MIIGLLHSDIWAQGYNLKFNRVIDTVVSINHTTCTDIYNTPVYGDIILTVPNGAVWKVTSLLGSGLSGANTRNNCSSSSFYSNSPQGYAQLYMYSGGQSYPMVTTGGAEVPFPLWLNAGTIIKYKLWSASGVFRYSYYDMSSSTFLSIIEFLKVP